MFYVNIYVYFTQATYANYISNKRVAWVECNKVITVSLKDESDVKLVFSMLGGKELRFSVQQADITSFCFANCVELAGYWIHNLW